MKNIPVYRYPFDVARANGEIDVARASHKANLACKEAIEEAIHNHYANNRLNSAKAVPEVVDKFGYERVLFILAITCQWKNWDARINDRHKTWARTYAQLPERDVRCRYVISQAHPGLVDLFITACRKAYTADKEDK